MASGPDKSAPGGDASQPGHRPVVPKATHSMDELLAKLRSTDTEPADFGAPDGDALAQAEAVLDGAARTAELEHLVGERTEDLQRLQAEYANYRKRVERDRTVARQQGVESVVRELMPIWDAINQAANHEELTGGFKLVAGEFTRLAEKLGLVSFGAVGDEFDPALHEALMQIPAADVEPGHLAQIIQPGYRIGDVVLRPARVAVASNPQ